LDLWTFALSLSAALFFAFGLVLTTFGLRSLTPLVGASFSIPTSFALFLALAPVTIDFSQLHWQAVAIFALAGLFYPAMVTLLNFLSNRALGPNLTGGLGNLTPIFAIGIAIILLGEVPTLWQWVGIIAVCTGLVLLAMDRARSHPGASLAVMAIPLAAAFLRGAVQPVVKIGMMLWPSAFAAVLFGYMTSTLVVWSVRLASGQGQPPGSRAGMGWFALIGFCNGSAMLSLYAALRRGDVVQVAPVVACFPLITIALNRLIHGDRSMGARGLAGSVVSVAGVVAVLMG